MGNTKCIYIEAKSVLVELMNSINHLGYDEYTMPIPALSNGSIGEHTRHVIEVFQKLIDSYEEGIVDYDTRARNKVIETNIDYASECIAEVVYTMEKENKVLGLTSMYNAGERVVTSYEREILYNIEHCIHHQALIKIGFISLGKEILSKQFGVAMSTMNYKKSGN